MQTSFFELDLRIFKKFAINTGIRFEDSKLLGKGSTSPRFSSAFKLGRKSQVSYAYGEFYQTPDIAFDKWYRTNNISQNEINFSNPKLDFEYSEHHILNYEYTNKKNQIS